MCPFDLAWRLFVKQTSDCQPQVNRPSYSVEYLELRGFCIRTISRALYWQKLYRRSNIALALFFMAICDSVGEFRPASSIFMLALNRIENANEEQSKYGLLLVGPNGPHWANVVAEVWYHRFVFGIEDYDVGFGYLKMMLRPRYRVKTGPSSIEVTHWCNAW